MSNDERFCGAFNNTLTRQVIYMFTTFFNNQCK